MVWFGCACRVFSSGNSGLFFKPVSPVHLLPPVPKENPRQDFKKSAESFARLFKAVGTRTPPGPIHAESGSAELRFGALDAGFDAERRRPRHSPNREGQPSVPVLGHNRAESRDSLRAESEFGAPTAWLRLRQSHRGCGSFVGTGATTSLGVGGFPLTFCSFLRRYPAKVTGKVEEFSEECFQPLVSP